MTSNVAVSVQEPLVPPINIAMVCGGVYRSGYPTRKNYPFLRALRFRSIVYLCPEDYAESNLKFCEENGISVLRFPTEGNKEPFNDISEPLMHRILTAVCDTQNHPLLIHCNKGKHRTGTVVACIRLLQGWSMVSIFEEYKRFAADKARVGDQQYVELYRPIVHVTAPHAAPWLCPSSRVKIVHSEKQLLEEEARQLETSLLAPEISKKPVATTSTALGATAVSATTVTNAAAGIAGGAPLPSSSAPMVGLHPGAHLLSTPTMSSKAPPLPPQPASKLKSFVIAGTRSTSSGAATTASTTTATTSGAAVGSSPVTAQPSALPATQ